MTEAPEDSPAPFRSRSRAFGIDLALGFEAPGLPLRAGSPGPQATAVELAPERQLKELWDDAEPEVLLLERSGDGEVARTIERDRERGYHLYARGFGRALISIDGYTILCSPPGVEPWSWQRFLVGRILPWAAVIRGLEALHASAVVLGGSDVLAITGGSGSGKTSLAVRMVLAGAEFYTDDVLVAEPAEEGITTHPGPGIMALRDPEAEALGNRVAAIGSRLGHSGKTYLRVADPTTESLPLRALYILEPGTGSAVEIGRGASATTLLATSFIAGLDEPRRLVGLLDLAAALDSFGLVWSVRFPSTAGPQELSDRLLEHGAAIAGAG